MKKKGWINGRLDMHKITEFKDETIKLSKMKDKGNKHCTENQ